MSTVTREHKAGLELVLKKLSEDGLVDLKSLIAKANAAPEQEAVSGDPAGSFDKHMEYMRRCIELEKELAKAQALLREARPVVLGTQGAEDYELSGRIDAFLSATAQPAEVKS